MSPDPAAPQPRSRKKSRWPKRWWRGAPQLQPELWAPEWRFSMAWAQILSTDWFPRPLLSLPPTSQVNLPTVPQTSSEHPHVHVLTHALPSTLNTPILYFPFFGLICILFQAVFSDYLPQNTFLVPLSKSWWQMFCPSSKAVSLGTGIYFVYWINKNWQCTNTRW